MIIFFPPAPACSADGCTRPGKNILSFRDIFSPFPARLPSHLRSERTKHPDIVVVMSRCDALDLIGKKHKHNDSIHSEIGIPLRAKDSHLPAWRAARRLLKWLPGGSNVRRIDFQTSFSGNAREGRPALAALPQQAGPG